jgi:hypothetical protein
VTVDARTLKQSRIIQNKEVPQFRMVFRCLLERETPAEFTLAKIKDPDHGQ